MGKIIAAICGILFGAIIAVYIISLIPRGQFLKNPSTLEMPPQLPRITAPQTITARVTAYDPYDPECVEQYAYIWPRKTPGGTDPDTPGAATDNDVLPLGTKLIIPNLGTYIVDDTGRDMRKAARRPLDPVYWIDVRIPAPYKDFPNDPQRARKEAHEIAKSLGAHWEQVQVIPPDVHN